MTPQQNEELAGDSGEYTQLRDAIHRAMAPMEAKVDAMHKTLVGDDLNPYGIVHLAQQNRRDIDAAKKAGCWAAVTLVGALITGAAGWLAHIVHK